MVLDYLAGTVKEAVVRLDFNGLIFPLLLYTFLIAAFAVFVWIFYKSISKRDLFQLNIQDKKKRWQMIIIHVLKHLVLFPIFTFLWFAAMTIVLFFISKSQSTQTIMLISMAMIAAARITAYYKQEIAQEIAKIMPLAVLGLFVADPTFFSFDMTIAHFYEVPLLVPLLLDYLAFAVLLEFLMRFLLLLKHRIHNWRSAPSKKTSPKQDSAARKVKK